MVAKKNTKAAIKNVPQEHGFPPIFIVIVIIILISLIVITVVVFSGNSQGNFVGEAFSQGSPRDSKVETPVLENGGSVTRMPKTVPEDIETISGNDNSLLQKVIKVRESVSPRHK